MSDERITLDYDVGGLRLNHSRPCRKCHGAAGRPGRSLSGEPTVFACGECDGGTVTEFGCDCELCEAVADAEHERRMRDA